MRDVSIPSTTVITQTYFANNFPALHDKGISLLLIQERFDDHPLHGITFGNQAVVQAEIEQCLLQKNLRYQDCLGMTPLHLLLCSGRDYRDIRVIVSMIEKCPDVMLIKDIWGEVPLAYALMGNASVEIINCLFMTHNKRWDAMPFDFGDMVQRLVEMGKSAQFMRDVIRAQRTHFPGLGVDWQYIVAESMFLAANIALLEQFGTFRVLVEASVSVRRYICMSDAHCLEVDARICEIASDQNWNIREEVERVERYFVEIRDLVTRYVQLHHELLQEAGDTLFLANMPKDAIKHVLSFL